MSLKQRLREFLPPPLVRAIRALRGGPGVRFSGPFPDWGAARAASSGYDSPAILERVREAALAVCRGEAAFERDSVRFGEPEAPAPILGELSRAALAGGGRLHVLDFGGSLGSTFQQCRRFLPQALELRWAVVDQPAFVECGRREFETAELRFFDSIEEAAAAARPDVALALSALQYPADPDDVARHIARAAPATIVVDRTPVRDAEGDEIVVQHVNPSIYRASYPFRIFGRGRLEALFGPGYAVRDALPVTPFEALEHQRRARYAGFIFDRA